MTRPARHGTAGVTLIEMMIVLVIIGVAAGAMTLGLGALGRDNRAEHEARRLAAAIGLGVDAALIAGAAQPVVWDAAGYQIGTGARHALDTSVTLARADGSDAVLILAPDATSQPADFLLQGDGARWQVAFDGLAATVLPGAAP
jgi:general secretion pathway protein H